MIIARITYTAPLERVNEFIEGHRAFLKKNYADKKFVLSGPQQPRVGGIIIVNATSIEEARDIAGQDPFLLEKVAEYDFIEFTPTMYDESLKSIIEQE